MDYFYADDDLMVSTQPERLQRAFDVLNGLLNWIVLHTNTEKTVGMVWHPYHAPGGILEEAYARRATGKGPTFREQQRRRVEFPECGVEVAAGSLLTHCQIQNGVGWGTPPPPTPQGGPDLPGILTKTLVAVPVPGSRVPGWGVESDQPQDSLFTPLCGVHNCDPGGR